jgi:hypothetical protein
MNCLFPKDWCEGSDSSLQYNGNAPNQVRVLRSVHYLNTANDGHVTTTIHESPLLDFMIREIVQIACVLIYAKERRKQRIQQLSNCEVV